MIGSVTSLVRTVQNGRRMTRHVIIVLFFEFECFTASLELILKRRFVGVIHDLMSPQLLFGCTLVIAFRIIADISISEEVTLILMPFEVLIIFEILIAVIDSADHRLVKEFMHFIRM